MTDKSEWPAWDYWMREKLDDGRFLSIYYDRTLKDGDVRSEKYEADHKKWCREYFWDPVEAACLSFLRDPNKLKANDRWLDDPDECDYEEHTQLWTQMSRLHDLIVDAQEKTHLPPEFFPPAMYVAWAKRVGVDIPKCVRIELERVERERAPPSTTFSEPADDAISGPDDELPDEKVGSQDKKFRNNAKKVILALLLKSGLISKGTKALSEDLDFELKNQRQKGHDEITLGWQTIKRRLDESHDLLK